MFNAMVTEKVTIAMVHNPLNKYLNVLLYDRNIIGSSSKIFDNLRKFSENSRERLPGLQKTFGETSESALTREISSETRELGNSISTSSHGFSSI